MNEHLLRSLLNLEAERCIDRIQLFDEIDSTNSEALRELRAGSTENRVVIADSQTSGRGRRGREWHSPKNSGIYLSLTRAFSEPASALQGLSLTTAISVVEALEELGVSGLQLKWPNDVLCKDKKLAGILLELQSIEDARYVVFGVGINRELSADAAQRIDRPVTDLRSIVGEPIAPDSIVAALLNRLCLNLKTYESSGFARFEDRWNSLDCYRMRDIVIQNGESRIIGKSLGVDSTGALLLETAEGIQSISGGEVLPSLRPIPDGMKQK